MASTKKTPISNAAKTMTQNAKTEAKSVAKKTVKAVEEVTEKVAETVEEVKPVVSKATKTAAKTVKKAVSKKEEPTATVTFEFNGNKVIAKDILAKAKKAFEAANKDVEIKTIDLYVVAEENAAYYVVNGMQSDDYKIEL